MTGQPGESKDFTERRHEVCCRVRTSGVGVASYSYVCACGWEGEWTDLPAAEAEGRLHERLSSVSTVSPHEGRQAWCRVCRPDADPFVALLGYCYEHAREPASGGVVPAGPPLIIRGCHQ